jgi:RHS repeat-associated protein
MVGPGGTQELMYDPSGGWLGVYEFFDILRWGDRMSIVYTGSETYFNHVNHLSSTTMMTSHFGASAEDMLFYPWGQVWESWGSGGYNFADMPYNDASTNTNLTAFRFQSPGLGRWLSPDRKRGDVVNPQSWNRYAYTLDNPTSLTDPYGLWTIGIGLDWGAQGYGYVYNGYWGLSIDQYGNIATITTPLAGGILAVGQRGFWTNVTISSSNANTVNDLGRWSGCVIGGAAGANWIGVGGSYCKSLFGKGPQVTTKSGGVGVGSPGAGVAVTLGYTRVTYLGNIWDAANIFSDDPDSEPGDLSPSVTASVRGFVAEDELYYVEPINSELVDQGDTNGSGGDQKSGASPNGGCCGGPDTDANDSNDTVE